MSSSSSSAQPDLTQPEHLKPDATLSGGGDMGALMRTFDWSKSPLGPASQWPQSLKTAVRIILTSRYAMFVWWGRELINLYNDPYRAFLGGKHPGALGRSAREVWAEIWQQIGPRTDAVLLRGESTYDEALLLLMERHGYQEETYFTFSYSPLPDEDGKVGGLFCAVTEETQKVIGERRLALLRESAAAMANTRTPAEACHTAAESLSKARRDLPFGLIYLASDEGNELRRCGLSGIGGDHPGAPTVLDLGKDEVWPVREVMATGQPVLVEDLQARLSDLPAGDWDRAPDRAILFPVARQGQARPAGVLIAALNPYRRFDEEFRGFVSLLADQIAAAIANAAAYEAERRRAEALAELDRAKTQFFSNVSHEFRTPLTLMLGPLEDVLDGEEQGLEEQVRESLSVAHRNALRLLRLVNTLLDFSRLEAGRIRPVYEATDLAMLTAELASTFRSAIERAGMRLVIDCPPLPEPVYVDREMWEKVVLNLLSNAFKFTFEGTIEVGLRLVGPAVQMTVRDTGTGIPAHEIPRLFERFHSFKGARGRSYEGSGIGLALVQELVRLHGGEVRAESEVGRGACFTVSVPRGKAHLQADHLQGSRDSVSTSIRAEAYVEEAERWLPPAVAVATASASAARMESPAKERSLIVVADDNADMRAYLSQLLQDDYKVYAVADGTQAIEATRRLHPALVLTDVMMPGADGFDVVQAIRGDPALSRTPVIVLSARAGEESCVEGLGSGADDYLVKPFTARELRARVAAHLKLAQARDEAEAGIRESEKKYRDLVETATIGLHWIGPDGTILWANQAELELLGYTREEYVGHNVSEFHVDAPVISDILTRLYRGDRLREYEARLRAKDGSIRHVIIDSSVLFENGKFIHTRCFTRDITERKQAEQALRESEQRFRVITDASPVMVWMAGTDRLCNYFNKGWLDFVGRTLEQELGNGWVENVHSDDLDRCVQVYATAFDERRSFEMEYRLRHHSGQYRWITDHGVPRFAPDGTFEGYVGGCLDVHDQKTAAVARQRLAAIVESSDDAIISKDLNGIVTSWNRCAERMFGYTAEEMIGQPITTIIPPELLDDERRILATIARGERIEHFETLRMKKSGERIDVSLTVSPMKNDEGKIIGAAKIARDITQNKRNERALRTTERLASVGRLAATVAHEINNPLEAVTNFIYLARQHSVRDDVRGFLGGAEEELQRISHLAKQTLGFYRETQGAGVMTAGSALDSLVPVFASKMRNKGIDLRTEVRQDPEIHAVPGEVRQLIANLLNNSIDAVEDGGRIRVRVSAVTEPNGQRRPGVRLTIADSGPGIPRHVRTKLFEPFFTTKSEVGTGLGLWVCKSIVEKHHGSIRLKTSTTPGRSGTAFSVFLPLSAHSSSFEEGLPQAV